MHPREDSRTDGVDKGSGRRRWLVALVVFGLSLAAMCSWALATPIGAVPDEPSHFIRAAAVARGQFDPGPVPTVKWMAQSEVPEYVAHTGAQACFAFHPEVTAACQTVVKGNQDRIVPAGQTAEANSPLFYAAVGLPSLILSGNKALYAMRFTSAALSSLLIAVTFMSLSQLRRPRWAYLAAFVGMTPMVLFLGGSLNPNAVEATGAAALFATLVVLVSGRSSRGRLLERLSLVLLSTVLLTGTRDIALLWVILAVIAALLLGERGALSDLIRNPFVWLTIGLAAVVCLAELLWFLKPASTDPIPPFVGAETSPVVAFVVMMLNTFDYGLGWVGIFGWLDTPAPAITLVGWIVAISAITLPAIVLSRGRHLSALLLLVGALLLVPALSQAAVVKSTGYIWQGRYTLAIFMMVLIAAGICLDRISLPDPNRLAGIALVVVIALLGVGHLAAFLTTLRRYVIGYQASPQLMITQPHWQPPGGWPLLTIFFVVVVAISSALVVRATLKPTLVGPAAPATALVS